MTRHPDAGFRAFLDDFHAHCNAALREEQANRANAILRGDNPRDIPLSLGTPEKAATDPLDAGRGIQGCSHERPETP